eukprot:CAMPEP_0201987908 /NCGR_PEP_ID=MMETSP0904-20121228/92038_1 /ASSEMBLY_ACC=CAM_ASM_000553 /TAXON_ID=420261 /ORGANISM="Thalassiosira antarctica, Strain CCMP982" /LENGTH=340 /DNA_ID=CAMNT_0048542033 /DNA_START=1277 /DNA_END=2300 /DNA_ORIENTATION=-
MNEGYDVQSGGDAYEWRRDTKRTIIQLIHETVATLRNERHAAALARNVGHRSGVGIDGSKTLNDARVDTVGLDDPMVLVHALRSHLFHTSNTICRVDGGGVTTGLELFERCKLIDLLHEFTISYRNLLRLASSPLPFVLVQMGRTFIFIWTLTIPLVLTGDKFVLTGDNYMEEYPSAFFFVILLTYGFLGLEFVSRMLSNPFGGEIDNDFNIKGMGSAAIIGIEADSELMNDGRRNRVGAPSRTLRKFVQNRQESIRMSTRYIVLDGSEDVDDSGVNDTPYRTMNEGYDVQSVPSFGSFIDPSSCTLPASLASPSLLAEAPPSAAASASAPPEEGTSFAT